MTREEAITVLKAFMENPLFNDVHKAAFNIAIHDIKQEPCDDCISRQAALKQSRVEYNDDGEGYGVIYIEDIEDLPPVTPQPKVGRWEWVQYDGNPNIGNWHCSECRTIIPHMPEETDNTPIYKWCPMCGAKMEVEK